MITRLLAVIAIASSTVTITAQPSGTSAMPAVSPDGRSIAFLSDRGGSQDLYVANLDGTGVRQLTKTPENEGRAEWSSDGRQLLYAVAGKDGSRLFAIDVAGGAQTLLGMIPHQGVVVSPDRARVAYMSGTYQASRLAIASLDGSGERILTTPEQTGVAWNARFSPDRRSIAFTGQDGKRQLHVFVVDLATGALRQLTTFTPEQGRAQVPAWSKDGTRIAFQLSRKGVSQVYVVDAAGGEARAVTPLTDGILDEVPSWFADGRRLAFQSTRSGRMEIWTVGADGSDARQITGR